MPTRSVCTRYGHRALMHRGRASSAAFPGGAWERGLPRCKMFEIHLTLGEARGGREARAFGRNARNSHRCVAGPMAVTESDFGPVRSTLYRGLNVARSGRIHS